MCSHRQWCFAKCAEGLGCFNNVFSCKVNSKEKKFLNTQAVVSSEDIKELLHLLMLGHQCSIGGGKQCIFEDKLLKFEGFCSVKRFHKCW